MICEILYYVDEMINITKYKILFIKEASISLTKTRRKIYIMLNSTFTNFRNSVKKLNTLTAL